MFKDIGSGARELLEDDYFYSQRLRIKTTNASEMSWLTEGELSTKGASAAITATRKGSTLSLDKLRVKSDGRILVEASLLTSNTTKLTMSAEDGRQEPGKPLQSFGKLGCEFKIPGTLYGGTISSDIDVVNGPIFRSSGLYNYSKAMKLGGEIVVNTRLEEKDSSPELADVNVGISYDGPGWNLTGKTMDSLGTFRLSYTHDVSNKLTMASQLDYRIKGSSQKLSVGSRYLLDDSVVKAKIDSNAIFASSFTHQLSKFVKMTMCAEVDIKDWAADSHKFGVGLTFE